MVSLNRLTRLIIIFILSSNNLFSSILFDKENIVITELDIITYKKSLVDENDKKSNISQLIKDIFLIKKTINRLKKTNPLFIKAVDNEINSKSKSVEDFNLDLIRYSYIRNNFIKDYYKNKLTLEDLKETIKNTENVLIPLSYNKCSTIEIILDVKNIKNFESIYFNKIKNSNADFSYVLNSKRYEFCLSQSIIDNIENELLKIIIKKTEQSFKNFLYEK